jgi:hypothetical protein
MHNYRTVVLLLLLIASCNLESSEEVNLISFDDSIDLNGELVLDIDIEFKLTNANINVIDTFLIIQTNVEPFFRIYSTNTHKLLVEFGTQGNGPQEFNSPQLLKQFDFDPVNNSPVFQVFDLRKQLFAQINIFDAIENQGNSIEVISINTIKKDFFVYFFGSNNNFIFGQIDGFNRLLIYDGNSDTEIFIGSTPELPFIIAPDFWTTVYRSSMVFNKEKGIIALAPTLLGQVDFFNLKGNYLNSLVFEKPTRFREFLNTSGREGNIPYIFFSHLETHEDLIYGLNYNNRITDYMEIRENNMNVLAFDWNANPIKKYVFSDGRLIVSFAFDPIHNRFYAFCPDEQDNNIVIYQIPENR